MKKCKCKNPQVWLQQGQMNQIYNLNYIYMMNISIISTMYTIPKDFKTGSSLVNAVESVGGHLVEEGLLEPQPRLVVGQTLAECLHQQRLLRHRQLEVLVRHAAVLVLVHPLQRDLYQILHMLLRTVNKSSRNCVDI